MPIENKFSSTGKRYKNIKESEVKTVYTISFNATGAVKVIVQKRGHAKIINEALTGAGIAAETTVNKTVDFTKPVKKTPSDPQKTVKKK